MAAIDKIVQVTVTKTTSTVSSRGFGIALGLFQIPNTTQAARYAEYSTLQELLDAGFVTTDPAYEWAQVITSQDPRPIIFALGRQVPGTKKVTNILITTPDAGTWQLDITYGALSAQYSYLAGGGDTDLTIAEGLRIQIEQDPNRFVDVEAGPLVAPNFDITDIVADTAGIGHAVTSPLTMPGVGASTVAVTVSPIGAELPSVSLPAVQAESDDFYIYNIESRDPTDILDAATFAAANLGTKLFVAQTNDIRCETNAASNVGETLNGLAYKNVKHMYTPRPVWMDAGMSGVGAAARLDGENGQITWAYKTLIGVGVDTFTTAVQNSLEAAHCEYFIEVAGEQVTMTGKNTDDEFTDLRTTMDWTQSRVKESVFGSIVTQPTKLPYSNNGLAILKAAVLGPLNQGVVNAHFSGDFAGYPRVTVPPLTSIPLADKGNRIVRNILGEAIFDGAIHQAIVQINVSV